LALAASTALVANDMTEPFNLSESLLHASALIPLQPASTDACNSDRQYVVSAPAIVLTSDLPSSICSARAMRQGM
jgi:hypothetical protein